MIRVLHSFRHCDISPKQHTIMPQWVCVFGRRRWRTRTNTPGGVSNERRCTDPHLGAVREGQGWIGSARNALGYPLAARVATAATKDFTTDAGSGVPRLDVSTSASINGPVMKATVT